MPKKKRGSSFKVWTVDECLDEATNLEAQLRAGIIVLEQMKREEKKKGASRSVKLPLQMGSQLEKWLSHLAEAHRKKNYVSDVDEGESEASEEGAA